MIPVSAIEQIYVEIINGATTLDETRFRDAGPAYARAFEVLREIGALDSGTPVGSSPLIAWGWTEFEPRLIEVIESMAEDQYLILAVKFEPTFVQFAAQGAGAMRAEVSSNSVLPPDHRLTHDQTDRLRNLGWRPPTGSVASSTPNRDPEGSPNFFIDAEAPGDVARLAHLAVTTLVDVLQVPYPGDLTYQAFDGTGTAIMFPTLRLTNEPRPSPQPTVEDLGSVRFKTCEVVRSLVGDDNVDFDSRGDLHLQRGSVEVRVRVLDEPLTVRVRSVLVADVIDDPTVVEKVNEINLGLRSGRVLVAKDVTSGRATVWVSDEVPASPFEWRHVAATITDVARLADQLDDELSVRFGTPANDDHQGLPPDPNTSSGYL